jgi:hypothetical protein
MMYSLGMDLPRGELVSGHLMGCAAFDDKEHTTSAGQALHNDIWRSGSPGDPGLYLNGLAYLAGLRREIDVIERELVVDARAQRFTWRQIGRWLHTTRQGAYNRFGGADGPINLTVVDD